MTFDALVAAGCEFQVVEAPLEEPFLGYYRASARMWNQLRREFLYAAEQVGRCHTWLQQNQCLLCSKPGKTRAKKPLPARSVLLVTA